MRGNELIRKIKKLGRKNGIYVKFVARRGKGSHGTLFYGEKFRVDLEIRMLHFLPA